MKKAITALLFLLPFILHVDSLKADTFEQEKMIVDHGEVYLVSPSDTKEVITVYNFKGQKLWEVKFKDKILSIDLQPEVIFVFTKCRDKEKTYLTCLNRVNGRTLWERP